MKLAKEDLFQIALILAGLAVTGLFSVFLFREIYPEYKIYQEDYLELEQFRSSYTGQPIAPFKTGIKQIVLEREDKGPAVVDRCVSCHVALEIPAFSPTKVTKDAEGKVVYNEDGYPILKPNEEFIWNKLDQAIADLRNKNDSSSSDLANKYEALKTAHVDDHVYDMKKVLSMHPLIGKETRPFEFHPIEEYGCTSCHNGNGNGLTTKKAHGPVFDGEYEIEFTGHVPQFLEKDPVNDPVFSRVFNGKPGHELLFQTKPIYVGGLIQAKCVQCHQTSQSQLDIGIPNGKDPLQQKSIDDLTKNYQQGRNLYIEQACYACHKIAAFSRGGVGPELTMEGNSYPWYVKQKITWPQSDLKTSTMPNMHLDHEEVEDLMTFMLAQKGSNKAVGEVPYRAALQAWDNGRKLPWEKPISPAQIYDLDYSMTVFATEGCAACHRLKGFESNVGYAIEKDKPSFDQLHAEHDWFQKLFPELISGSQIVDTIDKNGKEIDERIVADVRQNALLEEIEKKHPNVIESFYSNFKYAQRAKNHADLTSEEIAQWKKRIHRVLMMFVQEYGLGRLIGPRPNWSGVYRTDEWLMQHFNSPSSHVPRSLMPSFPFDDTKFYALTYMLDTLAIRNRDAVQEIWGHFGFNPEIAYQIYCSQCHGDFRQGNGPVSEWIYPIPKNLTSEEFLRNLTKEKAFISILHGINGTPMPPWGEVGQDKPKKIKELSQNKPILSTDQINQMVNWLFSSLPDHAIDKERSIPKWNYSPQDAIKELEKEGNIPKLQQNLNQSDSMESRETASLDPASVITPKQMMSLNVDDLFDVLPNSQTGSDKDLYFIKKKFYTDQNIKSGQKFFLMNCAVCHGNEGDGSGIRAATMSEAKPQMLTNLNWLKSHDDLRYLRSIKYGIPGTAMTAWGDLTTSLLRMQLVMFIRNLSKEADLRALLSTSLYETFTTALQTIDEAHTAKSSLLEKQRNDFDEKNALQKQLTEKAEKGLIPTKDAIQAYENYLEAGSDLTKEIAADQILNGLKNEVRNERDAYQTIGTALINKNINDETFNKFLQIIALNKNRYADDKSKLIFNNASDINEKTQLLKDDIIHDINDRILLLEKEKQAAKDKSTDELHELDAEIVSFRALIKKVNDGLEQAKLFKEKQKEIYLNGKI